MLWARLIQRVYNKVVIARNFCLLSIICYLVGQLWYNGTKIIKSLKQQAFKTGNTTILCTFSCGVAAFVTNPKYSHIPGAKDDVEEGLQRQETPAGDMGLDQVRMKLMPGPVGQRLSE